MEKEPITFEYAGARFVCEVEPPADTASEAAPDARRADLYVRVDGGPRRRVAAVSPDLPRRDAEGIVVEWYDGF